jgi:spermine synthase
MFEYDFDEILFDKQSEYQRVCIYRSPTLGNALFLDDLQNLAESDLSYTRGIMNYGNNSFTGKEILILGGGDGGLLHELLKENPKFITMVDIDKVVIEACRVHLRGACGDALDNLQTDRYHVIIGDCIKYMEEAISSGKQFDFVFNDLTDIPLSPEESEVGRDLWGFVRNILNLALKCTKKDGKYLNHVCKTHSRTKLPQK